MAAGESTTTLPAQPREGTMWRRALAHWLIVYRQNWQSSVFSSFLVPLLFLGAMGYLLGPLVDGGARGGVPGVEYVVFLAPGLLVAQSMMSGVNDATFPVMAGLKWRKFYYAMLATPLGVRDILLGHLVFVALRLALTSTAFWLVAFALGAIRGEMALLALPVAVLTGMAFVTPVFAFSISQRDGVNFNALLRVGVMPLFLFSGTFFPLGQLPDWFEPVPWLTPLAHGIELSRDLVLGTADAGTAVLHLAVIVLWLLVGFRLAAWAFRRRLVV